jgi:hypothetical protein
MPRFVRLKSAVHVVDLGTGRGEQEIRDVLNKAHQMVATGFQGMMIWIFQEDFLAIITDEDSFILELYRIIAQPGSRTVHCAVLPFKAAERTGLVGRLKGLGMGGS